MRPVDKRSSMKVALKLLSLLILLFSFSIICVGQTAESDEPSNVIVPEQTMKQVVRKVLVLNFKPENKPKVIYLAKQGLQQSWLLPIKNIKFRLLSSEEIQQKDLNVYFFTKPERLGNTYNIGFAFGEPNCKYQGASWHFRISKQQVRLWQSGGIGGGCAGGS